ncbi:hypothetical protein F8M41_013030 [Gigaspora margarita]|uniref:Uncharacterized protein n=1 Tax=Gigaspora margarita TaxID=4874 RepID=A0A8H4ASQ5_GIGMA|nr:hypothetical protein F8M41_013030 [Gigaspora margarita]
MELPNKQKLKLAKELGMVMDTGLSTNKERTEERTCGANEQITRLDTNEEVNNNKERADNDEANERPVGLRTINFENDSLE